MSRAYFLAPSGSEAVLQPLVRLSYVDFDLNKFGTFELLAGL
jgi:hypothetical protein